MCNCDIIPVSVYINAISIESRHKCINTILRFAFFIKEKAVKTNQWS